MSALTTIFLVFFTLVSSSYGRLDQLQSCPSLRSDGSIVTRQDITLKGHVRQSLDEVSFIQCGLRCQRHQWCISINFQITTGQCELNDYGVKDEMATEGKEFEKRQGFVYSQLRHEKFGCQTNVCLNGGTCSLGCLATHLARGYSCKCIEGYSGSNCEYNINECSSSPCQNGGTCSDMVNGYNCTCLAGLTGTNCEANINECSSTPCQNGGTCSDRENGYSCACVTGFTGTNCEKSAPKNIKCELYWMFASTTSLMTVDNALSSKQLNEFTISLWLNVPTGNDVTLYPFSYATSSITSALSVAIKTDGIAEITVQGSVKSIQSGFKRNSSWQHCAITWLSDTGTVTFYRNGVQTGSETGLQQNSHVPSGGTLIIGQYQGSFQGGFDSKKLMVGYMADLNIWSKAFNATVIASYSKSCFSSVSLADGVLSWTDIMGLGLKGALVKSCPSTCPS